MKREIPDTISESGANKYALKILSYWQRRGRSPQVRVIEDRHLWKGMTVERPIYVIRSNMVGGWPQ